jgi:hypothetical protein
MHTVILAALVVTLNGTPVTDAQICGFRASSADTPFHRFFASNDVECGGPFAPGLWNVFARRGKTHISGRTLLVDTRQPMPDVEFRLEPAATIAFGSRPGGAHGVVYLTDTLSAFPAGADGTALVPAERDLVPIIAKDDAPLAVGSPLRAAAGKTQSVVVPMNVRTIATWLSIAPEHLEALRTARRIEPPQIVAVSAKATVRSENPLHSTLDLNGAMQFLRDVPAGVSTLEVSGTPWKRMTASVDVAPRGVVTTASPLTLVPASSIDVTWAARRDLAALTTKQISCPGSKEKKALDEKPVISILSCKSPANRDSCTVTAAHDWTRSEAAGDFTFEDLSPGTYLVEFTFADLPPLRQTVKLERFTRETVKIDADYNTLFGRVTIGGKPLSSPARINFGFLYDAVSDDDGNFTAVLAQPLKADRVISVRGCDGARLGEQIVDHDVLENSRFDIDLPANRLLVQAVDAESGAPVEGAHVRFGAFRGEAMTSAFYFRLATAEIDGRNVPSRTDADGRFVIQNLPPGKTLRVCLEHAGYERSCADPPPLTSDGDETMRITMKPKKGSGRIVAPAGIAGGQLYWFAVDGRETERTEVAADGVFRYSVAHDPTETVAFVSLNLPLFVFLQPELKAAETPMVVLIPAAASRTFSIEIGENNPQMDALTTIAIGGIVVPYPAFAQHCALHGSQLQLMNRGPLVVPDILETGPIVAILGPPPEQVTAEMRRIDLFRLPQFRGLPRKPVGAEGRVVF